MKKYQIYSELVEPIIYAERRKVEVIVEVKVIDIKQGESIFIPEHLVVGKVRQCKSFKRLYLYPSQEKLQQLIIKVNEVGDIEL